MTRAPEGAQSSVGNTATADDSAWNQRSIFDEERRRLADVAAGAGMARAESAVDPDEIEAALERIRERAALGADQCACDERRDGSLPTTVLGPLFKRAEAEGIIRFRGYHRAKAVTRRGSPHAVRGPGDVA